MKHQPIQIDLIQSSLEWIEFRKSRIGASDANSIIGIGFKTPFELWQEKLGLKEFKATEEMRRRLAMEEDARIAFISKIGIDVKPAVFVHPKHEWMAASLDGISDDGKIAVEIKCPGKIDHDMAEKGKVPLKYIPQVQHQMEVLGLDEMYYFSFNYDSSHCFKVYRDQEYIDKLIEKEKEFLNCIENLVAPFSENDYKEINDESWIHASNQYLLARQRRKKYEEEEEFWKQELIDLSGRSNAMGNGIKLSKVVKMGRIDYDKIPEIAGINLEQYRGKNIEYWKVS